MIIYDIPKEFRVSTKLDLSNNFAYISSLIYYISIRNKTTNEELKFFACDRNIRLDIVSIKDKFGSDISISIIYNSCNSIIIDYSMYDLFEYKSYDYLKEVERW